MQKIIRKLIWLIVLAILTWFFTRIQIEWLWFDQFNWQVTLIRRWVLEFIGFFISTLISLLCINWSGRWIKTIKPDETNNIPKISGYKYTSTIIITLLILIVSFVLLYRLTSIAIYDPLSLGYWWAKNITSLQYNIFITFSLFLTFALFIKRIEAVRWIQIISSILFITTITRGWGLWAIAITIPKAGITDQLYGADVSFGLAQFPAISVLLILSITFLFIFISTSFWIQLTSFSRLSDWSAPELNMMQKNRLRAICTLTALIGAGLLWLSRHNFLWTSDGIVTGAGWLDVHFNIPIRTISVFLICIFSLLILPIKGLYKKNLIRICSLSISLFLLLIEFIFTPILQWMVVKPRELNLETKYLEKAIKATRKAFQLDSMKTRLINPQPRLTSQDLELGKSTLRNIRLWDSQPLLATNRQLQQFRVYYKFTEAAVDRYKLLPNSKERQQVMIAARELDQKALPKTSRTWLNKHFVFTHGYGFTMSPVNTKAEDGLPDYFISDLGISTRIEGSKQLGITKKDVLNSIPIGNPAIYFGNLNSTYAVAPTLLEELDYPQGDQNIFNHYSGNAGIKLNNIWKTLLASVYLREPRLLNTGVLINNSRLLLRREVKKRIKSIAPFLDILGEPYLVSSVVSKSEGYNNNQYWIIECYTSSRSYPYSSNLPNGKPLRYIRNSVKAIVDAYSGNVKLYITEPNDPIINGWQKLFPNLFEPLAKMPNSLREHLKVPTELFKIQVMQLLRYHVTDPRTFYNGDDIWQVPKELYGSKQVPVEPYHITAQLRPNEESEFLLLQPLTPLARPNLSAWLAARSDSDNYGELVLLRFPNQSTILGPEQIQALINQNPEISQQFSLWDRAGSEVIQGNLLVLPLGKSLLYVEPVYLKASQGGLPTLTRVVVSDGKRISMAKDLSTGLKFLLEKQKNNESEM